MLAVGGTVLLPADKGTRIDVIAGIFHAMYIYQAVCVKSWCMYCK